ncbi:putative bifunctional diguanylate cyclase/phosphodiesterase [Szabonella alba]|uniref:GGDEF domain-containing protein n=1 Tax=Szabonella alba TaxID=2804194 RepID=A0A8K0Y1Z7_9RHOB|nr:GGDEF domain-containing phosphodiesterase [Szabonella alba]MBL4918768.1 GGDEF domain-containing protein [Szabonella alba]
MRFSEGRGRLERLGYGLCRLGAWLRRAEFLVFVPALTLASFWLGGEPVMILTALGLPMVFAMAGAFRETAAVGYGTAPAQGGFGMRLPFVAQLDELLARAGQGGRATGCLVIQFDDAARILTRHGRAAEAEILNRCCERIYGAMREGDLVARLEGGGLAVALAPMLRLDLEALVQVAARLQAALSPPISLDGMRLHVTASVGFCHGARAPHGTGASMLDAAQLAADEALRHGPGAIRAFAPDMARRHADRDSLRLDLERALDDHQIRPHFQPQIDTDTGAISGFEALARWHHPERGLIPPSDFLAVIDEAGLSGRLGESMLFHALSALVQWDRAGLAVPRVSVNFCSAELRNPKLADNLKWELDRFGITPDRLSVEILETVVAEEENDIILRNIRALAALGCGIDMDDFGTGSASIANIRRYSIRRIKIDRSFIARLDTDPEQRKLVSAILSMAERLGISTLAEGVETAGEYALLSQLGCGNVQGYHIARPMPLEETEDWVIHHRASQSRAPKISQRAR